MKEVRVAIVGFGGIARSHYTSYCHLVENGVPVRVVAVVDQNAEQFKNNSSINLGGTNIMLSDDVHTYASVEELLSNEDFDMADICLPSFLHKEFSVKLMKAGKHVLCEKPMALNYEDCEEMLHVSQERNRRLMVGQCLRFEPSYLYLKECVETERYGRLRYLSMERLSEYPAWSVGGWLGDPSKCGGCIIDMHIHDIDMVRFLLGEPDSVSCVTYDHIPHCQIVNSRLFYKDATVVVDGAWDEALPFSFKMGYSAKFDRGSVTYDGVSVRAQMNDEELYTVRLPEADRVADEIKLFVSLILDSTLENTVNSADSAAKSVKLVRVLADSAACGGKTIQWKEKNDHE